MKTKYNKEFGVVQIIMTPAETRRNSFGSASRERAAKVLKLNIGDVVRHHSVDRPDGSYVAHYSSRRTYLRRSKNGLPLISGELEY